MDWLQTQSNEFLSIAKAAQAISSELLLDHLIHRLTQVAIELSGAQRGCLILCREGRPTIEAEGESDAHGRVRVSLIESQPLAVFSFLPASVIEFVRRTMQRVLLADATASSQFSADDYLIQKRPKSVLCLPITRQTKLLGIIYLENYLEVGGGTDHCVALLEILTSQAAISLDHAYLHCQTLDALRMREEFLAVASHELRTPMTSLLFALEAMRRWTEPAGAEELGRRMEIALRQGKKLNQLINDLFQEYRRALSMKLRVLELWDEGQSADDQPHATSAAIGAMRALQAVSGELLLDRLLHRVAQVAIELVRAQKGYVILSREGRLTLEAEATVEERGQVSVKLLDSQRVTDACPLPAALVHFVARTQQKVLLADATAVSQFSRDGYLLRTKPTSVVCLPIMRQSELLGVIYLESHRESDAFVGDDLVLLDLLAKQAAISLQNASVHHQAIESLHMRDEFLAVASHELRTPMTSLLFAIGAMRRRAAPAGSDGMGRRIEVALRQGRRLGQLINDLFDLSWIDGEMLPLSPQEFELSALVREVGDRLSYELSQARCALSIHVDAPMVGRWDRSRIDQMITNLLSNAMKFGAGRPIEVDISRDIQCGQAQEIARLAITDHGIGISPEHQTDIFQRFGRAVSPRQYGGLGLGLYICRRIVEAHHGRIHVSSQEGAGATFIVSLPISGVGSIAES